jgi:hypothetical protein
MFNRKKLIVTLAAVASSLVSMQAAHATDVTIHFDPTPEQKKIIETQFQGDTQKFLEADIADYLKKTTNLNQAQIDSLSTKIANDPCNWNIYMHRAKMEFPALKWTNEKLVPYIGENSDAVVKVVGDGAAYTFAFMSDMGLNLVGSFTCHALVPLGQEIGQVVSTYWDAGVENVQTEIRYSEWKAKKKLQSLEDKITGKKAAAAE